MGSFNWGDNTPAWVFSKLLSDNPKYIGEATSHEIGHTLGLQHQSVYNKGCDLVTEYSEGKGDGEIGWAPIMGVGYYRNVTTWHIGTNIEGCSVIQNDIDVIAKGESKIGFRSDDHGNTPQTATPLTFYDKNFQSNGMINSSPDKDVFKFTINNKGLVKFSAIPNHVATGNSGANIDIKISLLRGGDTIGRYNPENSLSASVDTTLTKGTYYIIIDGVANKNVRRLWKHWLLFNERFNRPETVNYQAYPGGDVNKNIHLIKWDYKADLPVRFAIVEYSLNKKDFKPLTSLLIFNYKLFIQPIQY